jgi:hypothetical protein
MTKKWTIEYCTLKVNENSNHDFEYRMIAKMKSSLVERYRKCNSENGQAISLRGIMIDVLATKESEKTKRFFNLVTEQNKRLLNFSYSLP